MAHWTDVLSLVLTVGVLGGLVYGVIYAVNVINEGMHSTKEQLKSRGVDISANGVSVKTSKRFDRGDYVDATQRGMLKAMNAATFGKGEAGYPAPASIDRTASSNSSGGSSSSEEKKKKKGIFNSRK